MYLLLMTVLLSALFLVPCIGVLRWLKKGSMFNRKILLVASAVYVVFSVLAYVSYEIEVEEIILGFPPEARPYVGAVEIAPFSPQFGVILADGILLGVCWILTLKPNKKALTKTREIYQFTNFRASIRSSVTPIHYELQKRTSDTRLQ